ncbi:PREDICTED: putative F-box protein At1g47730 [Camelina sativa]|uniref:F-box protein At1g47730 n=1 Tax=Camelina sativa TaxID=90675 RepID=A0ABM0YJI1_CAMSA|nr:PREDICTED: putative F-box protein At1g47730 [Camelina sativa]
MEQPKDKIERKRNRRRKTSSSSSSLPLDLTLDIFLRLPVTSVVRLGCVSKLWSSLTNALETRQNLLLFFKSGVRFFVFSLYQHNRNPNSFYYSSSQPTSDFYHITSPSYCSFTIKNESVHGLICLQYAATPVVWNPTKREFTPLTKPNKSWTNITVFLGYDPIEGKHEVVCMPYDWYESDECRVLTLGSAQEQWRTVKTNYKYKPFTGNRTEGYGNCTCVNGFLYYRALIGPDRVIMRFDVRSETFYAMTLPWEDKYWPVMMVSNQGRLVCLGSSHDSVSLWVLKDAQQLEWSNHILLPLSHYGRGLKNKFKLIGITGDGELIYVPTTALKSDLHIIYINPMTKTFRRVEYNGIANNDFRQRYGLGERPLRGIQYFPNHIEPFIS